MDNSGGYAKYGFVAEIYDHIPEYYSRSDTALYLEYARACGGEILELGCGTGRILIPLAQAGAKISGIDLSEHMLAVCHKKIEQMNPEIRSHITLKKMDMRKIEFEREFNMITAPFRSFQHLSNSADQQACLRSINEHLHPDGRLILDLFNPSLFMLADQGNRREFGEEDEFSMPDGRRVLRRGKFIDIDYFRQLVTCEMIYYITYPDHRKERLAHRFFLRYTFRYEIEYLLNKCGFEVEDIFGDYERNAFGSVPYPGELIVVARKTLL